MLTMGTGYTKRKAAEGAVKVQSRCSQVLLVEKNVPESLSLFDRRDKNSHDLESHVLESRSVKILNFYWKWSFPKTKAEYCPRQQDAGLTQLQRFLSKDSQDSKVFRDEISL